MCCQNSQNGCLNRCLLCVARTAKTGVSVAVCDELPEQPKRASLERRSHSRQTDMPRLLQIRLKAPQRRPPPWSGRPYCPLKLNTTATANTSPWEVACVQTNFSSPPFFVLFCVCVCVVWHSLIWQPVQMAHNDLKNLGSNKTTTPFTNSWGRSWPFPFHLSSTYNRYWPGCNPLCRKMVNTRLVKWSFRDVY